jgi:hypothetical protein
MGGIGRVKLPVKSRLLRSLVDGQSGSFASDLRLSANLLLLKELRSEDCQGSFGGQSLLLTSHCRSMHHTAEPARVTVEIDLVRIPAAEEIDHTNHEADLHAQTLN